jgi:hypothetical protein
MLSAPAITFDESLWPLQLVRFVGSFTPQQYEDYLAQLLATLQRGEMFIHLPDLTQLAASTSEQRRRQAEWLREHESLMRERMLGLAFVITSPAIRLALSTIFFFKPPPVPYFVAPNLPEAAAWAAQRFEDAGLALPAERIRRHFGLLPAPGTGRSNGSHS